MNITRRLWLTVGLAAAASVLIEVTQYIFLLGRSDVSDVLCNTAGALVGAVVSWLFLRGSSTLARRWAAVVTAVTLATVVVFAVLVLLGPALGDPAEVAG